MGHININRLKDRFMADYHEGIDVWASIQSFIFAIVMYNCTCLSVLSLCWCLNNNKNKIQITMSNRITLRE